MSIVSVVVDRVRAYAGFINAVFAKKFDDISIVPTFVLTPLTYLGGVFYSISLLPEFWQTVSKANPILYMVNAFRYGILGVSDISIGVAYAILVFFVVLLFSACLYLLNRGIGIQGVERPWYVRSIRILLTGRGDGGVVQGVPAAPSTCSRAITSRRLNRSPRCVTASTNPDGKWSRFAGGSCRSGPRIPRSATA